MGEKPKGAFPLNPDSDCGISSQEPALSVQREIVFIFFLVGVVWPQTSVYKQAKIYESGIGGKAIAVDSHPPIL